MLSCSATERVQQKCGMIHIGSTLCPGDRVMLSLCLSQMGNDSFQKLHQYPGDCSLIKSDDLCSDPVEGA